MEPLWVGKFWVLLGVLRMNAWRLLNPALLKIIIWLGAALLGILGTHFGYSLHGFGMSA